MESRLREGGQVIGVGMWGGGGLWGLLFLHPCRWGKGVS